MSTEFPAGFLWATAAHQVEGNNVNSDFWVMEHAPGTIFKESSGASRKVGATWGISRRNALGE